MRLHYNCKLERDTFLSVKRIESFSQVTIHSHSHRMEFLENLDHAGPAQVPELELEELNEEYIDKLVI